MPVENGTELIHLHQVAMMQCEGLPSQNYYDKCSASVNTPIAISHSQKEARAEAAARFRRDGWAIDDETESALCPKCKAAFDAEPTR